MGFISVWLRAQLTDKVQNTTDGLLRAAVAFGGWGVGTLTEAAAPANAGTAPGGHTALSSTTGCTEARVAVTSATRGTSSSPGYTNDQVTWAYTITCGATGKTITETAVFDAAGTGSPPSGANMGVYSSHGGVALVQNDSITYTHRWISA